MTTNDPGGRLIDLMVRLNFLVSVNPKLFEALFLLKHASFLFAADDPGSCRAGSDSEFVAGLLTSRLLPADSTLKGAIVGRW
jgi:hypothetical protein